MLECWNVGMSIGVLAQLTFQHFQCWVQWPRLVRSHLRGDLADAVGKLCRAGRGASREIKDLNQGWSDVVLFSEIYFLAHIFWRPKWRGYISYIVRHRYRLCDALYTYIFGGSWNGGVPKTMSLNTKLSNLGWFWVPYFGKPPFMQSDHLLYIHRRRRMYV